MKRPRWQQQTLDGSPYVERNRLGLPMNRIEKRCDHDYVLGVFGPTHLNDAAWVRCQLDQFVMRYRQGILPQQIVVHDGRGVLEATVNWARKREIPVRVVSSIPYKKKWPISEFGRLVYARYRDTDILDLVDVVVALWGRRPKKTPAVVALADAHGKLGHYSFHRIKEERLDSYK